MNRLRLAWARRTASSHMSQSRLLCVFDIRSTKSWEQAVEQHSATGHALAPHDRAELPQWTQDRVTLLGDACHPMLPMMAQGAAQSIEDGAALASLPDAAPDDVPSALRRYEAIRKPRATRLQEMCAANRTRFHLPDGLEQQQRDDLMANGGDRSLAKIGRLYEYDAAVLS